MTNIFSNLQNILSPLITSAPFGLFIIITLVYIIFYIFLYKHLNLNISRSSCLFFVINLLILTFFLFAIYNVFKGLPNPIYIKELSAYSQYRYLLLTVLTILGSIIYLISLFSITVKNKITSFMHPYLKEEIIKLLKIKEKHVFGPIFTFFIEKLYFQVDIYKNICSFFSLLIFFLQAFL